MTFTAVRRSWLTFLRLHPRLGNVSHLAVKHARCAILKAFFSHLKRIHLASSGGSGPSSNTRRYQTQNGVPLVWSVAALAKQESREN